MPYFAGAPYQRGHGLGNIFSALRSVLPGVAKSLGRYAVRTGVEVAKDWLAGKKIKDVLGTHAFRGAVGATREIVPQVLEAVRRRREPAEPIKTDQNVQTGSGRKRKRSTKRSTVQQIKKTKKKPCCDKDIFD